MLLSAATKIQRTWRKTHGMGYLGRTLNPIFEAMRDGLPADPCAFAGSDTSGYVREDYATIK